MSRVKGQKARGKQNVNPKWHWQVTWRWVLSEYYFADKIFRERVVWAPGDHKNCLESMPCFRATTEAIRPCGVSLESLTRPLSVAPVLYLICSLGAGRNREEPRSAGQNNSRRPPSPAFKPLAMASRLGTSLVSQIVAMAITTENYSVFPK